MMLRDKLVQLVDFIFADKDRTKIIILNLAFILLLVFFRHFIVVLGLIIIAGLSMIHMRFTKSYIGFELCTFATIFCGMFYGAKIGMLVGAVSITLGLLIAGLFDAGIVLSILIFFLMGAAASLFPVTSIFAVGIIFTILYDIIIGAFYLFIGSNPVSTGIYIITHFFFNFFIFKYLGTFVKHIVA